MFIYLDESGDLGFELKKPKTSAFFVITLLVCENRQVIKTFKTSVNRTLRNKVFRKSKDTKELKGAKTDFAVKKYFFKQLPKDGWFLYSLCIDKTKTIAALKQPHDKKKLYNFFARLLLEKVKFSHGLDNVNLIVDRSKNKAEIKEFNQYIENHLEARLPFKTSLHITHEASHENQLLQAVDLFCWGVSRKHENADTGWYEFFSNKIILEEFFPENKKDGPFNA